MRGVHCNLGGSDRRENTGWFRRYILYIIYYTALLHTIMTPSSSRSCRRAPVLRDVINVYTV